MTSADQSGTTVCFAQCFSMLVSMRREGSEYESPGESQLDFKKVRAKREAEGSEEAQGMGDSGRRVTTWSPVRHISWFPSWE